MTEKTQSGNAGGGALGEILNLQPSWHCSQVLTASCGLLKACCVTSDTSSSSDTAVEKRDVRAYVSDSYISKFIPSRLQNASPNTLSTLLNYQSCIVLQTSAVMLSGFFLWSGPSHKTTVKWVIDPAMKMAILLCINMKAAYGTGALSDSSLFLLRGKIHTQLMAVQREALLWDIK